MNILGIKTSVDKTKKYYFKTADCTSTHIEACLLNLKRYGYIICVSSQIGCTQGCKFCAAGMNNFVRNLSSEEIQGQVDSIVSDNPKLLSCGFQVTYMGAGEPLNNAENVFHSIDSLRERYSVLSKVNISTTGPTVGRTLFKETDWDKFRGFLHFQYSLHFTRDAARAKYLWPHLLKIDEALDYFNKLSFLTNDVYKINYIPFDHLNDDEQSARELGAIMKATKNAKLKISRMCEIVGGTLMPSRSFDVFVDAVTRYVADVEVFNSDGMDVNAGCGQFYNESIV